MPGAHKRRSDIENESAPARFSRKWKRDGGESGLVVGASSLSASQPLHDLASQAHTASTSQAQHQTINADANVKWEWRDGNDFFAHRLCVQQL